MTKCSHQIHFLLPFSSKVLFYFKNRIKEQLFIYLRLCWVFIAAWVFSLAAESRGHSLAGGAQASHRSGFSRCGAGP